MKFSKITLLYLLGLFAIHPMAMQAQTSTSVEHNQGRGTYSENSLFKEFEIEYEGEIEVAEDDRSITNMAPGAYLKVSKSAFGSSRKVVLEADENGKISRKYYTGWRQQEFVPEGRDWLREMMPEIVRTTAVGARSRINRFYRKGGINAVLNEIPLLQSDFLQATYLQMVQEKNLSDGELASLLKTAGEQISSDFYLAKLLKDNMGELTASPQLTHSFINAAKSINSDFYLSDLLTGAVKNQVLNETTVANLLKELGAFVSSDHYLSNTLISAFKGRQFSAAQQIQLIKLADHVASDHYRTQFLITTLDHDLFNEEVQAQLVKAMAGISSDHYLTQVVKEYSKKELHSKELESLLKLLATQVSSDHYLSQSLSYLIRSQKFNSQSFRALIGSIETINSDHYATQVVDEITDHMLPTEGNLVALIKSLSMHLASDHYLSESLSQLAPLVKKSGAAASDAYWQATKTIQSDTYLGKASRAMR